MITNIIFSPEACKLQGITISCEKNYTSSNLSITYDPTNTKFQIYYQPNEPATTRHLKLIAVVFPPASVPIESDRVHRLQQLAPSYVATVTSPPVRFARVPCTWWSSPWIASMRVVPGEWAVSSGLFVGIQERQTEINAVYALQMCIRRLARIFLQTYISVYK